MGKPTPPTGSPEAIDAALAQLAIEVQEYQAQRQASGFATHDSELRTRLFIAMRKAQVLAPNIAIAADDHMVQPASFAASTGRFAPWLPQQAASRGVPFTEPGHSVPEPAE